MEEIVSISNQLTIWYEANCNNGDLSWAYLAKKAECSSSYLAKIAKGQSNPSYEASKKILKAILPDHRKLVNAYLFKTFPKQHTHIESLEDEQPGEVTFTDDNFNKIVEDPKTYRLFRLTSVGTYTKDDLTRMTGTFAGERIEFLKQSGHAVEIDGKISRSKTNVHVVNTDTLQIAQSFKHNIDIMEEKARLASMDSSVTFDNSQNKFIGFYESLNEPYLKDLIQDFVKKANEARAEMRDKKNQGDVPMFVNITIGRLDDK